MLKKISLNLLLVCCCSQLMLGQQTFAAKDMVAITPMISGKLDLPQDAKASLGVKLGQIVTQNGFGSNSGQFVLTANVVMLDKQTTATAPVQFMTKLEVSVYAVDVNEQLVLGETSFVVTGVDRLENKAVIQAINQIRAKSPDTQEFMNECRKKIITYYNTRVPTLLTKAKSLAGMNQYSEALEVLAGVPECVDQYPAVAQEMTAIYLKYLDRQADAALAEAKGKVAIRDYAAALEALQRVDPSSSKAKEALGIIAQIKGNIDASEQRALDQQLRAYEDSRRDQDDKVTLAKLRIEAARQVGVEQAKSSGSLSSKLNRWFMGKFK